MCASGHDHHHDPLMLHYHVGHTDDHAPSHAHHGTADDTHHHSSPHVHRHGFFGLPHSHGPVDGAVGHRSVLALGISGGLLPCPSALVVLLSAIAIHRVAFGMLLIVSFSLGLALVLTAIGLVMVYAGRLLERVPACALAFRFLPVVSTAFVTLLGLAIAAQALQSAGLLHL